MKKVVITRLFDKHLKDAVISKLKSKYLLRKRLPHPIPIIIGIGFAKTIINNNI